MQCSSYSFFQFWPKNFLEGRSTKYCFRSKADIQHLPKKPLEGIGSLARFLGRFSITDAPGLWSLPILPYHFYALQTSQVVIGVLLKHIQAIRTAAKVNLLSSVFQGNGRLRRFFRQAGRAYDQILRFCKALLRISNKDINAALATEKIFLTFMGINACLVFTDS